MIRRLLKRFLYAVMPPKGIEMLKVWLLYRIFDKYQPASFPEQTIFEKLLKPGDTALDVGANIGLITKVLMQIVGPAGKIYSIEPLPYTFKVLAHNIERSGARNVTCYDVGISDRDGKATITVPTFAEIPVVGYDSSGPLGEVRNYHFAHLTTEKSESTDRGARQIVTRSLDSLFAQSDRRISLIKCSTMGSELQCMLGAERILMRDRPALFIDPCSDPDQEGSPMFQLTDFLHRFGYVCYLAKAGKLQMKTERLRPKADGLFSQNLFFLTEEHFTSVTNV